MIHCWFFSQAAYFLPLIIIAYCYFHILHVVLSAQKIQSSKEKNKTEVRLAGIVMGIIGLVSLVKDFLLIFYSWKNTLVFLKSHFLHTYLVLFVCFIFIVLFEPQPRETFFRWKDLDNWALKLKAGRKLKRFWWLTKILIFFWRKFTKKLMSRDILGILKQIFFKLFEKLLLSKDFLITFRF